MANKIETSIQNFLTLWENEIRLYNENPEEYFLRAPVGIELVHLLKIVQESPARPAAFSRRFGRLYREYKISKEYTCQLLTRYIKQAAGKR